MTFWKDKIMETIKWSVVGRELGEGIEEWQGSAQEIFMAVKLFCVYSDCGHTPLHICEIL